MSPELLGKIFNGAADDLEIRGWIQGAPVTADGMCVAQAIATQGNLQNCYHWSAAIEFARFLDVSVSGIPRWNDAEGRTKEEVILTLRKAAAHFDLSTVPDG